MADIKKSFNFRNGLQVDDDNFVINANGLVGIGSTIPTEILDVGGNVRIRGSITASQVIADNITNEGAIGTASLELLTVGVTSISNGIITATGSGIVTYYGDARYLQGMPTSQWVDTDVGLGFTSVYSAGNVGVGTTDPRYTFQVGGTNSSGVLIEGVGISSSGYIDLTGGINASSSGIVTANRFVGSGASLTSLNASELTSGSIPANVFGNINTSSGIITASEVKATTFTGTLVGIATSARELISTARVDIEYIDADDANIGFGTFADAYVSGRIGIGSTSATLADVHVDTDGVAAIKIQSHDDESRLILGRNDSVTNSFVITTDNTSSSIEDSGLNSVDIVNYNPGHVNFQLYPSGVTGKRFNWINSNTNTRLMSLTQTGELGIGISNPTHDLHVVGTSTITSHSLVGGNFEVAGITTLGSLNATSVELSGQIKTSSKIGIGLTTGDDDPTHDLQVGFGETAVILSKSGDGKFTGIVTATEFSGIGSNITDIKPENIIAGTITGIDLSIDTTGIITATRFVGSGASLTNVPISSIGSGNLNGDININAGTGIITATTFVGSGASLTDIPMSAFTDGDIDANININAGTGIITATRFVGSGVSLTGIPVSAYGASSGTVTGQLVFSGITTFTGNMTIGTVDINSTGIITASNFYGSGANLTNISATAIEGTYDSPIESNENLTIGLGVSVGETGGLESIRMATSDLNQGISTHTVGSIAVGFSTHNVQSGISSEIWSSTLLDSDEQYLETLTFRKNYYSTDYQILAINGTNYQTSKVLVLYNGGSVIGIETYSNININNQIARYEASVSTSGVGRTMTLNAIPESGITGITTYKVHLSSIH